MLCRNPSNKMIYTDKNFVLYCSKGHGTFSASQFEGETPKCPTCGEILLKMEGVVKK